MRTTVSTESAVIKIRDNGPGTRRLLERVLEPFFTTKRGGGLGLPIAKRSAELHGGSLTLSSPPAAGPWPRLRCRPARARPRQAELLDPIAQPGRG